MKNQCKLELNCTLVFKVVRAPCRKLSCSCKVVSFVFISHYSKSHAVNISKYTVFPCFNKRILIYSRSSYQEHLIFCLFLFFTLHLMKKTSHNSLFIKNHYNVVNTQFTTKYEKLDLWFQWIFSSVAHRILAELF